MRLFFQFFEAGTLKINIDGLSQRWKFGWARFLQVSELVNCNQNRKHWLYSFEDYRIQFCRSLLLSPVIQMAFDWLIYISTGFVSESTIVCQFRCRPFVMCVSQTPLLILKIRFYNFILLKILNLNENYFIFSEKNGSLTARFRDFLGCESERAGVLGFPRPCRFWQFVVSAPWRRPIFFFKDERSFPDHQISTFSTFK